MLVAVFTTGGTALSASGAHAQGFFWDSPPPKVRKTKRPPPSITDEAPEKVSGKKSKGEAIAERPVAGPIVINVSLSRQRLVAYDATGRIAESPVSSGRVGYSTPMGVFSVVEKNRVHHSNLYQGAPMPNMQRLTWSGVAMHAGALPGYPASHGCIRLPHGFSKKLFGMTKMGTRVIVSRDPVAPISFAHERLFAAYPPEDDLVTGSTSTGVKVADASKVAGSQRGNAVSEALGVTAAAAAGVGDSVSSVHLSYRERRRVAAERLTGEIRTAGYEKAEKTIVLNLAQEAAKKAKEPLVAARAEAERLADTLRKLEKAKAGAEREIADLQAPVREETGKKKRKQKTVMDKAKREARIAKLTEELAELPPELEAARSASAAADAALNAALEVAKEAEAKRRAAMTELMKVNAVLSKALGQEQAAKRADAKRHLPVSVFISRAKKRLYVRQGYTDIFNVEVGFDRPDDAVGTHVFTALAYSDDKTAMQWSAVSVPYDPARSPSKKKKDKSGRAKQPEHPVAVDLSAQTPAAALERITIPEDAREQIEDVMKPGSSLVISDLGISNETGEYTDFIASIR
jgi:lipoprotein-anchoring transpeptidase ErfK/SrfK